MRLQLAKTNGGPADVARHKPLKLGKGMEKPLNVIIYIMSLEESATVSELAPYALRR